MRSVPLRLSAKVHSAIMKHLLRRRPKSEEAAFCFATFFHDSGFECEEWMPVPTEYFEVRSLFHIELTDDCRAEVIKRAHDLGSSIIEFHSHPLSNNAEFSPSDHYGFSEFVPHVWWRLKGRPYAAVVVSRSSFDSLVWINGPSTASGVLEIHTGFKTFYPTGSSYLRLEGPIDGPKIHS